MMLKPQLGPDVTELSMRFGLHSGSVTAGVLRGDKARFQLFGCHLLTGRRASKLLLVGSPLLRSSTYQTFRDINLVQHFDFCEL